MQERYCELLRYILHDVENELVEGVSELCRVRLLLQSVTIYCSRGLLGNFAHKVLLLSIYIIQCQNFMSEKTEMVVETPVVPEFPIPAEMPENPCPYCGAHRVTAPSGAEYWCLSCGSN